MIKECRHATLPKTQQTTPLCDFFFFFLQLTKLKIVILVRKENSEEVKKEQEGQIFLGDRSHTTVLQCQLASLSFPNPIPLGRAKNLDRTPRTKTRVQLPANFCAGCNDKQQNELAKQKRFFYLNYPLPKNKRKNCHTVTLVPVQYLACVAAGPRTRQNHLYSSIQKVQSVCYAGNLVPSSKRKAFEAGKAIGDNKQ